MLDPRILHMVWLLLGLFLWMVFAAAQGIRDARFYGLKKDADRDHLVEKFRMSIIHQSREFPLFTVERGSVYLMIILIKSIAIFYQSRYNSSDIGALLLCIILIPLLIFPFIHDGHYYRERNLQDGSYKDRWLTNNSIRWGMAWSLRLSLLLIALVLLAWELNVIFN